MSAAAATPAMAADAPRDIFFASISTLCGQAFEGRVASPPVEADSDFAGQRLLMQVHCAGDEIRIPFSVGEDRSRTWVIGRQPGANQPPGLPSALTLSHVHRHEDGSEDRLSRYGGVTVGEGSETRQEFPADRFSRELFARDDLAVSMTNIWVIEVQPDRLFAYELRRPGRFFRVEFDLSRPVPLPEDGAD
jgi:hypothetical protein